MPHLSLRYRPAALTMMLATLIAHSATAAEPTFTLGSKEQVAEIRARCGDSKSKRLSAEVDPQLEFFTEYLPEGVGQWRGFLLYKSEIVAEQVTFHTKEGEDVTQRPIVRSTVPWATQWTKTAKSRPMRPSPDVNYLISKPPFYTATREGWVARLYESSVDGNLLVMKLGTRFDIDDSLERFVEKLIQQSREAKAKGNTFTIEPQQPFSLSSPERVALIRKTTQSVPPMPPLDKPDSGFELYMGRPQQGTVMWRNTLLYQSEIVAEEIYLRTLGDEPITRCEAVRNIVPWATEWTQSTLSTASLPGLIAKYPGDQVPLYTAISAGWAAKLYPFKTGVRLAVVKRGIPGLTIDDWVTSYMEKEMQKNAAEARAEEEKATKAKP